MKKLLFCSIILSAVYGCTTIPVNTCQKGLCREYRVEITSSTPGATIKVDDDYIGKTPTTWVVDGEFYCTQKFMVTALPEAGYSKKRMVDACDIPRKIHFDTDIRD